MAERYGKWPGIVAVVGDGDMLCVLCAMVRYGVKTLWPLLHDEVHLEVRLVYGIRQGKRAVVGHELLMDEGYPLDHDGSPLIVLLHGASDLHGEYCAKCSDWLCDEWCRCYKVGQAQQWRQYGRFRDE